MTSKGRKGGGRSGGLKDWETGQVASRAVPVPGPMADQAAMADPRIPAAMAERGARAAIAERGARAAMAERGARAAMVERGAREAMADRGVREAMADRGAWEASMVGSPPPPNFLGETLLRGVLRRRRRSGFW